MNKRESKKLYKQAVKKWGYELQLGMLMEESAELIQAVSKVLRKADNHAYRNLVEEIADVEVMIEQIKTVCTWQDLHERVRIAKHDKLLRLQRMLEDA